MPLLYSTIMSHLDQQYDQYYNETNNRPYQGMHVDDRNSRKGYEQSYPPYNRNQEQHERNRDTTNRNSGTPYGVMDDRPRNNQRYPNNYPSRSKQDDDSDLIKFNEPIPMYNGVSDSGSCIDDRKHERKSNQSSQRIINPEKGNYGIESIMNRGASTRRASDEEPYDEPKYPESRRRSCGDTTFHQSYYHPSECSNHEDDSFVESVTPGQRRSYNASSYEDYGRGGGSSKLNVGLKQDVRNEIRIDELSIYDDSSLPATSRYDASRGRGRGLGRGMGGVSGDLSKPPSSRFGESSISSQSLFDNPNYKDPYQAPQRQPSRQQPPSKPPQRNSTLTYSDYYDDSQSIISNSKHSISEYTSNEEGSILDQIIDDLPNGGEWYDTKVHATNLGVKLYAPEQLTQSLYEDVDYDILQILKERPVIGYIFQNSPLKKCHTLIGDILLAINNVEVTTPEDASALLQKAERPLKLLFYTPEFKLNMNEGFHMVKYDSNSIDAPSNAKQWKPKYVVIGGLIAKAPYIMSMYRSKADYDTAVRETFAKKPISVKIKQFSLMGASFEYNNNSFQSVFYDKEPKPWYYFVILPPMDAHKKGNVLFTHPIKIASVLEPALVRMFKAIQRSMLKVSNMDGSSGTTGYNMNSTIYDNGSTYYSSGMTSYQDNASTYHSIATGKYTSATPHDPSVMYQSYSSGINGGSKMHDFLDDESSYYTRQPSTGYQHDSYNTKGMRSQDSYYGGGHSTSTTNQDSYYNSSGNQRSHQDSYYNGRGGGSHHQDSYYDDNTSDYYGSNSVDSSHHPSRRGKFNRGFS